MKVEIINKDFINIFFNNSFIKDTELDKTTISSTIKKLITKVIRIYKLKLDGFYKIKVYPNKKIGIYLNVVRIEDYDFGYGMDYRVLVYPDSEFYLETEEYLGNYDNLYYDNKFYINIKDIENIIDVLDYGKIVFGEEIKDISNGVKIKKRLPSK